MRSSRIRFLLILLCTTLAIAPLSAAVPAITGGTTGDALGVSRTFYLEPLPPYAVRDNNGDWTGPAIDLLRSAADRTGVSFRLEERSGEASDEPVAAPASPTLTYIGNDSLRTGMQSCVPMVQEPIGVIGTGSGRGFLNSLTGLISFGFLKVALAFGAILLVFGTLFWLIERGRNEGIDGEEGDNGAIAGIGKGFWWAGVTATTIGYGDTVPKTKGGRVLAIVWMLISMAITAVLTAYLVSLTGGRSTEISLSNVVEGKRIALVQGSGITPMMLPPARSVARAPDLAAAVTMLEADAVDIVPHPYYVAKSAGLQQAVTRSATRPLMPVLVFSDEDDGLRREVNRMVLTPGWRERFDMLGD